MIITNPLAWAYCDIYFNDGQELKDFTAEFDYKAVKKLDKSAYWIHGIFRNDWNNGISGVLFVGELGKLNCMIFVGGPNDQQGKQEFPIRFNLNKWYYLKMEVDGSKLSVSIDGKLIADVDWSNLKILPDIGKVGLGAGGAEVHFDNFVITGDEVPDSGMPVEPAGKLATRWGKLKAF